MVDERGGSTLERKRIDCPSLAYFHPCPKETFETGGKVGEGEGFRGEV